LTAHSPRAPASLYGIVHLLVSSYRVHVNDLTARRHVDMDKHFVLCQRRNDAETSVVAAAYFINMSDGASVGRLAAGAGWLHYCVNENCYSDAPSTLKVGNSNHLWT